MKQAHTTGERAPRPDPAPSRGTDTALAAWIGRHQEELWRYLRFLGCGSDTAEDFAQETFLVALDKGVQELDAAAAAAWLRTTARNLYRMHLRRTRRLPAWFDLDLADLAWVEQRTGERAYLAALERCLDALDERARSVLEMRYAEDVSRAEMARRLGISQLGVKTQLRRIRARLRACVERRLGREEA